LRVLVFSRFVLVALLGSYLLGCKMSLFDLVGTLFSNASSAKQASANRAFQENMSDTAHQREVADLEAAGLNPILSANSGASTPGGAMGSTSSGGNIGNPIEDAIGIKQSLANLENTQADTAAKKVGAAKTAADTKLSNITSAKAAASLPVSRMEGSAAQGAERIITPVINSAASMGDWVSKGISSNLQGVSDALSGKKKWW